MNFTEQIRKFSSWTHLLSFVPFDLGIATSNVDILGVHESIMPSYSKVLTQLLSSSTSLSFPTSRLPLS